MMSFAFQLVGFMFLGCFAQIKSNQVKSKQRTPCACGTRCDRDDTVRNTTRTSLSDFLKPRNHPRGEFRNERPRHVMPSTVSSRMSNTFPTEISFAEVTCSRFSRRSRKGKPTSRVPLWERVGRQVKSHHQCDLLL